MPEPAIVAPIVLVQPVAIEVTDHLVEWDATIDMPKAHDFEATKQSDIVHCRDHVDDPEHLCGSGRRSFVLIEDNGSTLQIHEDQVGVRA